jgi:hypothetical protein
MGKAARRKKARKREVEVGDGALTLRGRTAGKALATSAQLGRQGRGVHSPTEVLNEGARVVMEQERRGPDLGDEPLTIDGKFAYPHIADANGDLHMEPLPLPRKMFLSTPTLMNLTKIAQTMPWCGRALDDDTLSRLSLTGKHLVLKAWKHTTEDWKRENVRLHVALSLRGQETAMHQRTIDLPSRQFGILLGAIRPDVKQRDREALEGLILPEGFGEMMEEPRWAAGRSIPKAWQRCKLGFDLLSHWQVEGEHMVEGMMLVTQMDREQAEEYTRFASSPRAVLAAAAFNSLGIAKLIVAEPEWVAGIDDNRPDTATVVKWAEDAHLPFPTVYFDFEGPGANLVSVPVEYVGPEGEHDTGVVKLAGALMWREGADGDGPLNIMPIATPLNLHDERMDAAPYEPIGRLVLFGTEPADDMALASVHVDGAPSPMRIVTVRADSIDSDAVGRIETPLTPDGDPVHGDHVWAQAVYAAAMRSLRVLYMLQGASNVELVEAPLHSEGRRRKKRADKRGWPIEIGLMVAVRWKKKLYFRPPGMDENEGDVGRGYSHAFWVIGHPRYYPLGTRIADALAERGEADKLIEHPEKGLCRMVWQPPFLKGLHDPETGIEREPVEKTRKIVGELPDGEADAA